MNIESKLFNKTLYVALSGELDEHTADYIRGEFDRLITVTDMMRVVVDMSELSFMDSTGIGMMIGRFKKLKNRSIPLLIANPSAAADKIFKMTGLYDIMPKIS